MGDQATPSGRLSTGVDLLDSGLGGGVPTGSLVAVSALPRAQSEPLLYAMAAANSTRYLSTLRPAEEVSDVLAKTVAVGPDDLDVDVRGVDGDEVLGDPEEFLCGLDANSLVVLDPTTELEQGDRIRYREFLDTCKRALRMTDSVGLFHCHENTPSVLRRGMTLARADQVWDVRMDVVDREVRTCLAVTKVRGGTPLGVLDLAFDGEGVRAAVARD
ncbi:RAD55 family ATPase [Halorientalis halophila]|uniref:RAD55 family ATPase n=1 Tax=Halorientalis halophila TaxID=3108499 RepID=UPI00300BCB1D